MHILLLLQTAFSVWMLVDAIRRGADRFWWVIVMVPGGEIAYFIAVVLPDLKRKGTLKRWLSRRPSLKQLRVAYGETPSHHNRVRLAQGLHDAGHISEAGALFEEALVTDAADRDALYGFAQCALSAGENDAAIEALETLVDLDMAYLDSTPALDLAEAYWESGDQDRALSLAESLCRKSQRVGPRAVIASYLIDLGRTEEARRWLEEGIAAYDSSPAAVRRRDRVEAREARGLLAEL